MSSAPAPKHQASTPARSSSRSPPPPSSPPPTVRSPRPSMSSSGLAADLGRLLETKQGSDVDFEVCGKVFPAHKLVLAARSPVLMADFFGPAKEKDTSYVRIHDMHPDAFEALLHYAYTDTLPPATVTTTTSSPEGSPSPAAAAVVLTQDLLVAADKYKLKDLKSVTENELCKHNVGVSTVLPMLELAEHHGCSKLKRKCLEFVVSGRNTTRAVMASDDLEHLARSCPSVVKEVLKKILDAREAMPGKNPLMVSVQHVLFYLFAFVYVVLIVAFVLCCVFSSK
ncbi:hypothetical protein HU200_028030 [Digitaria exilis]|uniref:BTB domain-containing protein n=1 Tax=Digitaria exilis TaxID=1010633 RepID=A0A835BWE1_9POAL|nr:hypothetical protein HU200_028030 [Digitaria exilis]CAB3503105.1 unnamed protein product [Digitaria exilis]